jgi:hypothetical protein
MRFKSDAQRRAVFASMNKMSRGTEYNKFARAFRGKDAVDLRRFLESVPVGEPGRDYAGISLGSYCDPTRAVLIKEGDKYIYTCFVPKGEEKDLERFSDGPEGVDYDALYRDYMEWHKKIYGRYP